MDNKAIADQLKLGARLLELYNENKFKIRSYESAARKIEQQEAQLADLDETAIAGLEGIGANIAKKVRQMLETGTFEELDRLLAQTPEGILQLLSIKGIGPKKIATAWNELGIETPQQFLDACESDRISNLKGFGKKTQDSIQQALAYYLESKGQFLYAVAESEALELIDLVENAGVVSEVKWAGALRRKAPVVEEIDLQVITEDHEGLLNFLNQCSLLINEAPDHAQNDSWRTADSGIPVKLHFSNNENWWSDLFFNTGAPEFVEVFREGEALNLESEEQVFQNQGWPNVPPEMREPLWLEHEVDPGNIEKLIKDNDLAGCIHNHSHYSDGKNSLREMAEYCRDQGLDYFGIADHSKAAFYANGLSPERLEAQMEEVDQLNNELDSFHIFKGTEADILTDGSLDFDAALLDKLDYVVASIHSPLQMDEAKATNRLIQAIEHPNTSIIGHMTGRLLLMRKGYPLDQKKVIDACVANQVVIEINANPRRLDIDWQWMPYALAQGAYFSINPDAHNLQGIHDMYYGVQVARKGGVPKNRIINTFGPQEIVRFFK